MRTKGIRYFPATALIALLIGGCARVQTYSVDKERVDQSLTSGNLGYLTGQPKESDIPRDRKATRKTYVTEVELGFPARRKARAVGQPAVAVESAQEPQGEPVTQEAPPSDATYTVQDNDTLEKISMKVYGTHKKWKKIYEANTDQLKSPDRIYGGQVLKVPRD